LLARAFNFLKTGQLDDAERAYSAIAAANPRLAVAHNHLGLIAKARGQNDRAEAFLRRAIELDPNDVSGHLNLGNLLSKLGRYADAETSYRLASRLEPDNEDCLLSLGWTRYCLGDAAGAEAFYRHALAAHTGSARAHNGCGLALAMQRQHAEAEACYRRALATDPKFAGAFNNLGVLLKGRGRYDEACDAYRQALAIDPSSVEALNNLGCALQEMGRIDEAKQCLARALALAATYADALGNLGNAHLAALELDQALAAYERAETLGPAKPDLQLNKSFVHLLRGDFPEGWKAYEARLSMPELAERFRGVDLPRWDGSRIEHGRLLILDEQGLGDTIQFLRFVPDVLKRVPGGVALRIPKSLRRLVPNWPQVELIGDHSAPSGCLAWTPLLSLPLALGLSRGDFPARKPYLALPDGLAGDWSRRFGTDGFRIGLAWSGSRGHRRDRDRSIPPQTLAPMFRVPGARLFSLQKEYAPGALDTLRTFGPIEDLSPYLADFAETGGAATAMDCVVSVDTSVAHLAGALGLKVLTLISYSPDWRWQLNRADSPWYPTMTLVRQTTPGDWRGAIDQVVTQIRTLAGSASSNAATATMSTAVRER
jgi:tetratricopeptide (TPR) repeat protein